MADAILAQFPLTLAGNEQLTGAFPPYLGKKIFVTVAMEYCPAVAWLADSARAHRCRG